MSTQSFESTIRDTLHRAAVSIINEVGSEFLTYCPFHQNTNTPSFSINKNNGLWQCFNPDCEKKGGIRLLRKLLLNEETRFSKDEISDEFLEAILKDDVVESDENIEEIVDGCFVDYDSDEIDLLKSLDDRGFSRETMQYFEVGFSRHRDRVVIPARDQFFNLVGVIGRAIDADQMPKYLYSAGFPKSKILFNLNNAKKYSEVIVVEGSLDAMKVHQAGFSNVVATLGAIVTKNQQTLLSKHFDRIVIIPDNDGAGFAMRDAIIASNRGKEVFVAECPEGFKDAGDLTASQIANIINNKINIIFS